MPAIIDTEVADKVIIEVNVILDRSVSMITSWGPTISGLNEYVDSLRAQESSEIEYRLTLMTFCGTNEVLYDRAPLSEIPTFTTNSIRANGSGTALYDAVGTSLHTLETSNPTLIVIITDGEENVSRTYSQSMVKEMIQAKTKLGNYTFVYLGVAEDAWGASSVFAAPGNTAKGTVTTRGMDFSNLASATGIYTSSMVNNSVLRSAGESVLMSTSNFYDDHAEGGISDNRGLWNVTSDGTVVTTPTVTTTEDTDGGH
jgi:hypothetical protein